jgi:hypothetical protein
VFFLEESVESILEIVVVEVFLAMLVLFHGLVRSDARRQILQSQKDREVQLKIKIAVHFDYLLDADLSSFSQLNGAQIV